jgi:putative pyruvate formate lyase activating enzyme
VARGFLEPWDPSGEMPARQGVLVRHLVLPGQVANSLGVLRLLHAEFGNRLPLSVMSQYRPMPSCNGRGAFARPVRTDEYREVCALVESLGFENVYIQELDESDGFVPDFTQEQPFDGNR